MFSLFKKVPEESTGSTEETSIESDSNNNTLKLFSKILPSGNEIILSEPLSENVNYIRNQLSSFYDINKLKYEEKVSQTIENFDYLKRYTNEIILNDEYEKNNMIYTSLASTFGVYCTSRILCNKNNWRSNSLAPKSFVSRIFTNLPARIILPVLFPVITFKTLTPNTFNNICKSLEQNIFNPEFTKQYHDSWDEILRKTSNFSISFNEKMYGHMELAVCRARLYIIDKLSSDEDD
ncbi:hypothetical protein TBLA_0B01380 [Henningerozyma blattae CBS 6284]|uniref:MICOS complex subunit n=1 Tax=Henningerozyma blattae (strain ATCC 34711 / CBS 6284 / DSM 70876 / NBRC 10599 / NRRL Y-10934 / UCD 77-7) TaxID=1071380 RepID=I2GXX9_HENB6|nr:hypothetical protein TBLA_0B01380 [Tetrapisispora blattae CBS 6284]CCH58981.1 hypothetical protein TBLA_0B01380 [Tetrapisispora blattae CBS 6284]